MIRVRLKLTGLNKLMRSSEVQAEVDRVGERMVSVAGDGFEYERAPHRWTARGFVQASSARGMRRQAREAVLERALAQVRGPS